MSAERQAPSPDPIRLLLVEDSWDDHQLISDLLDAVTDLRFTIDWAKDLTAGRDRLQNGYFDACLVDHRLPEGDGLELLKTAAIRGLPTPMILLTSHASKSLDQQAMALGASGFLDKNRIDPTLLERTIRYAMRQQTVIQNLARVTLRDKQTGLISPLLFRDRLAHALAFAKRRQSQVAIILIGLDLTEKHLAIQAKRLMHQLRETDTVARLADQQLALIVEGLRGADDAALVARKALDRLATPIIEHGEHIVPKPRAGIALFPEDCGDVDTLLRQADAALLQAKLDEVHRYRFGNEHANHRVKQHFLLSNNLTEALDKGALTLRYRPMVHVAGTMVSLSAELHTTQPNDQHLSTEQFLSVANDRPLIEKITDWIVSAATSELLAWRHQGFDRVDLALPFISKRALDIATLERALRRHLDQTPIDPDQIEIDLDHDLVLNDLKSGGHGLATLKKTGVRLALDGFGHDEANIHYLASGLLHSLKLSPGLYHDLPGDAARETLLKAIIGLGHDLDLQVVANGARDDHQFAFLKKAGCDAIKLQAAGSTLTAAMFTNWLQKNKQPVSSKKPKIKVSPEIVISSRQPSPSVMDMHAKAPLSSHDTV